MIPLLKKALDTVSRQQGLDKPAEALQKVIARVFAIGRRNAGQRAQNFLNGVWLGHPLHPVLTDLPIGFWTAALALDALDTLAGQEQLRSAADALLGMGIGSAVGAATTGLANWQFTSDEPRRVGLIHALLNTTALALTAAAFVLRRRGRRPAGRGLACAGYAIANAAAYLGGHLVYEDRIGVDHTAEQTAPAAFTPVLAETDLLEDQPHRADTPTMPVVLVRHGGQIYALADTCAHLGGPLSEGTLRDSCIICPWHNSRFTLAEGRNVDGPSAFPQPTLETRIRAGQIEVRARDAAGAAGE
jgi:nitrite reductase/ring-hydroxylating ferredoxin subunit/uncharacterized membrane protein